MNSTGEATPTTSDTRVNLNLSHQLMSQLSLCEGKEFQKKYEGYWAYLSVVILFYAIPTYQLLITYQKVAFYTATRVCVCVCDGSVRSSLSPRNGQGSM